MAVLPPPGPNAGPNAYSRAYVDIIYEKTKVQVSLGPLLGKQSVQVKEVYWLIV